MIGGYGIDDDEQIHAARFLRSAVHGFIDLECSGGFGIPVDLDASYRALVGQVMRSLRDWRSGVPQFYDIERCRRGTGALIRPLRDRPSGASDTRPRSPESYTTPSNGVVSGFANVST